MNDRAVLEAASSAPLAPPLEQKGWLRLTPIQRRRLDNFRRNRRGYWSFWIFLVLFVLSLFAEFIANDKPILVSYKNEILLPVFKNYPEEKFGGFLAMTDYRDPFIQKEIAAHGWAIWPPIRYSYSTHNLELPSPAPSPPTWLLVEGQSARRPARARPGRASRTAAAPASNGTGSAPTIRVATWSRVCSTAFASPSCSA